MCLDNDRCTQVQYAGKSMVYVPTKTIIYLMMLVLVYYSPLWIKLKLNCIIEKKKGRHGIQVYFPITFNSNAFNFLLLFVSGSDVR